MTVSAVARLLLYVGATIVMGDAAGRWIAARAESASAARLRLAWIGVALSIGALALLQAREMEIEATGAAWQMLLTQTAWGRGWSVLAVSAVVGITTTVGRAPRSVATAGALLLAIAMGGLGHASADEALPVLSRVVDAVHVIGVGGWLGGLLLMSRDSTLEAWRRYSRMASMAAPAVVLSGVLASLRRLQLPPLAFDTLSPSWTTIGRSDYGQLLLMKTMLVLLVLGYGLKHRRRVLGEHAPSGKTIRNELVLAFAVLVTTAVLTGTAPPGE